MFCVSKMLHRLAFIRLSGESIMQKRLRITHLVQLLKRGTQNYRTSQDLSLCPPHPSLQRAAELTLTRCCVCAVGSCFGWWVLSQIQLSRAYLPFHLILTLHSQQGLTLFVQKESRSLLQGGQGSPQLSPPSHLTHLITLTFAFVSEEEAALPPPRTSPAASWANSCISYSSSVMYQQQAPPLCSFP